MTKIITGFTCEEDVEEVLKIKEELWEVWCTWNKTENEWKWDFDKYQGKGGIYIQEWNNFCYWSVDSVGRWDEQINFKDYIALHTKFTEGEEVEVSDGDTIWYEAIYLCTIPGNVEQKYIVVWAWMEEKYKKWEMFVTLPWRNIRKLPKPKLLTLKTSEGTEVQISQEEIEKLGFKIV